MKIFKTFTISFLLLLGAQNIYAHCEIPCGIYNDSLRVELLYEHISTIEKSMLQIASIERIDGANNQLVRWVVNKEEHAKRVQEIVSQYFLHQRIKPKKVGEAGRDTYLAQLETLHLLSILAMKAKQSVDLEVIKTMRSELHAFEHLYFTKHSH